MACVPRIAIGNVQPHTCPQPISWAAMAWWTAGGCQVQHFSSRCCHTPVDGALSVTGQASRHLDSWLMSPDLCRACFLRGLGTSELAVIDGRFDQARQDNDSQGGGSLDTVCEWLDVPKLGVIDVSRLQREPWPSRPDVDGLLLDQVVDSEDYYYWKQRLSTAWNLPTLGGLEQRPDLRAAIAELPAGALLPETLCNELAAGFGLYAERVELEALARGREFFGSPVVQSDDAPEGVVVGKPFARRVVVAVAYDEAFHCYFPDMLDLLESLDAEVVDFSPMHDESLPTDVDLVYFGCGDVNRFAHELSENHCMMSSLRNHVCAGKRVYGDGGGLAYLSQFLQTGDGQLVTMVGALPAIARATPEHAKVKPVEVTLSQDSWLGPLGTSMRGYLNTHWSIVPHGPLQGLLSEPEHEFDLVGRYLAVGSRLQLNFATRMDLLRGFVSNALSLPRV